MEFDKVEASLAVFILGQEKAFQFKVVLERFSLELGRPRGGVLRFGVPNQDKVDLE